MIGCYGVEQGPQLFQFTSPYEVTSSIGCGSSMKYKTDLNALSCAKLVSSEENDDYSGFKKVVLDISKCAAKDNARFITMIRTAAARNFPQKNKNKEVELILIK